MWEIREKMGCLIDRVKDEVDEVNFSLYVAEMGDVNSGWRNYLLKVWFDQGVLDKISSVLPPSVMLKDNLV